jgi:hypothetical protein
MTSSQTQLHLATWIGQARPGTRRRSAERPEPAAGLRFAFYGRTSTERFQDRFTSRGWQWEVAAELVSGHGRIVREFFDVGVSRRVPWRERPKAAELLELISAPDCPFDAIVVGEYERAFSPISSANCCRGWPSRGCRCGCRKRPVRSIRQPDASGVDDGARRSGTARGSAGAAPGAGGDAGAGRRAGPVHGRPPAVRVSAGGRRSASKPRASRLGASAAPIGTRTRPPPV